MKIAQLPFQLCNLVNLPGNKTTKADCFEIIYELLASLWEDESTDSKVNREKAVGTHALAYKKNTLVNDSEHNGIEWW